MSALARWRADKPQDALEGGGRPLAVRASQEKIRVDEPAQLEALRGNRPVWEEANWRSLFGVEVTADAPRTLTFRYDDDHKRPAPLVSVLSAAYPSLVFEHEYLDEFASVMRREKYADGVCVEELELEPTDMDWVEWEDEE